MRAQGDGSGAWVASILAGLLAACAATQISPGADPRASRPLRTATPEELARAVDAAAAGVVSLKGKLTLELETAGGAARRCRGLLAARNPWTGAPAPGLFVEGTHPLVPTLFTLVSDGAQFWLHVPREHVVYTGPITARAELGGRSKDAPRLDARGLLRALFVQPLAGAPLEVREEPAAYVVTVGGDGGVQRRLWVERRGLSVEREVWYGEDGREELGIERGRFAEVSGHVEPERFVVRDLSRGGTVSLDFETLAVNPADVDGRAFRPRLPPGARVVEVGAGGGAP